MDETYFLAYDQTTGEFKGFYASALFDKSQVPKPNIEITKEKHSFYMQYNGQYKLNPETLEDVLITQTLDELKTSKKSDINQQCSNLINNGFYSYAEGTKDENGNPKALLYKSDLTHQFDMSYYITTLIPAHKAGIMTDISCTWKDASIEGPCHPISDDIIFQLYTEMGKYILWCKTTADMLIEQVNSATTVEEINAIVFPDIPQPEVPTTT